MQLKKKKNSDFISTDPVVEKSKLERSNSKYEEEVLLNCINLNTILSVVLRQQPYYDQYFISAVCPL